jgi:hypothetical protein
MNDPTPSSIDPSPQGAQPVQKAGYRMIYAAVFALAWGAACGYLRGPYWIVAVGALVAAAMGLWLERDALWRSATGDRGRRYLLIGPACAFLAMVALALSGIAYALAAQLHR